MGNNYYLKLRVMYGVDYTTRMNLYNLIFEMVDCIQIEIYEFVYRGGRVYPKGRGSRVYPNGRGSR